MIIHSIVTTRVLVAITLLFIKTANGENRPSIVGCLDVGCPAQNGNNDPKCTVVDKTYSVIGFAAIQGTTSNLTGVSWTEGVALSDRDSLRNFNTNFYFGTPPSQNLTGIGACAVFFNDVSNGLTFPSPGPAETSRGSCEDAMGSQCANALIKRATDIDFKNLDPACANSAPGSKWTGVTVKALTGPDAAATITSSQNSSSNCWPVLPKQNNLALVDSTDKLDNYLAVTAQYNYFNITPILTLFYPGNGSLITKTEAQLTCLKTIDQDAGSNATINGGGSGKDGKGAGSMYRPNIAAVASAVSFITWLMWYGS